MDIFHIVALAIIQGITEFLPISSSGHLLLPKELLAWPEQGLAFDVAVHVGTLSAVIFYFRKDIIHIVSSWLFSLTGQSLTPIQQANSRLAWCIAIATIPAGIAGLLFDDFIEANLRTTVVIASTTILFGVLLWFADRDASKKTKDIVEMTLVIALIIGCAQALALIPGTSRSGITITAALLCGLNRQSAARFSFLLAIPIILLSGGYKALQLLGLPSVNWMDLFLGVILSSISAFICIHFFLKFINRIGMMPFVIYRFILGGFLFIWAFS